MAEGEAEMYQGSPSSHDTVEAPNWVAVVEENLTWRAAGLVVVRSLSLSLHWQNLKVAALQEAGISRFGLCCGVQFAVVAAAVEACSKDCWGGGQTVGMMGLAVSAAAKNLKLSDRHP